MRKSSSSRFARSSATTSALLYTQGPEVDVLFQAAAPRELDGDLAQLLGAVVGLDPEHLPSVEEPLHVLPEAEDVDLALVAVPVAPDPLERSGAVMQGMRHHGNLGICEGDELVPEEGVHKGEGPQGLVAL